MTVAGSLAFTAPYLALRAIGTFPSYPTCSGVAMLGGLTGFAS
jgi:hypothetical protein